MKEAELQAAVLELAHLTGWIVHHSRAVQTMAGRWMTAIQGDPGFPDLVMAHRTGTVLFVELKATQGRLSEAQQVWRHRLEPTGRYRLWRPADWDDITAELTNP